MSARARFGVNRTIGICAGFLASMIVYALLRLQGAIWGHEPNPATLLFSLHAAYFWRAWTSAYAGAMVAIIVSFVARGREERAVRILSAWLVPSALVIFLQAILVP